MAFSGDVFTHLFAWDTDPQRQEKIVNARLEAEFDGIDAALTSLAGSTAARMQGGTLSASVASSALTIAVKTVAGADASTTASILTSFPGASGGLTVRATTGALSITVSSGSTLGHSNSNPSPVYIYELDNSGTVELAVSTKFHGLFGTVTTTAEGGAGAADSSTVMYSTTARTNVRFVCIGRAMSSQTTAGTWAASPTELVLAPFQLKSYRFAAELSVDQGSWLDVTWTKVNADRELYDEDSAYDAANYKFVCQEPGRHEFIMQAGTSGDVTGFVMVACYKNGGELSRGASSYQAGGEKATGFGHFLVNLVPGDTIELYALHITGATRSIFRTSNLFFGAIAR